jgi:hypothetical protein
MEMWGVTPYEGIWRVKVANGNWIKRMGNSVESGFQIFLPVCFDCNALPVRKPSKINKRVDECWIITGVPFPLHHCAIVPGFAVVTGVGTVLVALTVRKHSEAWKLTLLHS